MECEFRKKRSGASSWRHDTQTRKLHPLLQLKLTRWKRALWAVADNNYVLSEFITFSPSDTTAASLTATEMQMLTPQLDEDEGWYLIGDKLDPQNRTFMLCITVAFAANLKHLLPAGCQLSAFVGRLACRFEGCYRLLYWVMCMAFHFSRGCVFERLFWGVSEFLKANATIEISRQNK